MAEAVTQEVRVGKGAIHCDGCEATIERFLSRTPGVRAVGASEKTQVVTVTWDPDVLSLDDVKAKLDALGYPVER